MLLGLLGGRYGMPYPAASWWKGGVGLRVPMDGTILHASYLVVCHLSCDCLRSCS